MFLYNSFLGKAKIPLMPFFEFSEGTPSKSGFIIFSKKELYFVSFLFLKKRSPNPIKSYNLFCKKLYDFSEFDILILDNIQKIKNCSI